MGCEKPQLCCKSACFYGGEFIILRRSFVLFFSEAAKGRVSSAKMHEAAAIEHNCDV